MKLLITIGFGRARGVEFSPSKNKVHLYWSPDVCSFFLLAVCELERHLRTIKTVMSVKMRFYNFGLPNGFVSSILEPSIE